MELQSKQPPYAMTPSQSENILVLSLPGVGGSAYSRKRARGKQRRRVHWRDRLAVS